MPNPTLQEYLALIADTTRHAAMATQPPLTEIEIGGKVFPVGQLTDEQMGEELKRSARLQAGTASNIDLDPFNLMRLYLEAGDPDFEWDDLPDFLSLNLTLTFYLEFHRQLLVNAMAASQMKN
jgi:hypothetical protein